MTLAKDIASHLLKIQAVYLKPEEPFIFIIYFFNFCLGSIHP